ncbi:MAG: hypothetical protein S4CHLAM7_14870 [Chlamydiae bacterium]|nr:hypothetical protein [Chlamydiota bacterium]
MFYILEGIVMLKVKIILSIALGLLSWPLSAFSITGSESYVKEFQSNSSIRKLYFSAGPMDVYLTQGNKQSVRLEGDKDQIEQLDIKVLQGELDIVYKKGQKKPAKTGNVKIYITTATLNTITTKGMVKISSEKPWKVSSLNFLLTGSGEVEMDVNTKNLSIQISGSSELKLSGNTQNQNVAITGSGVYSGEDLKANTATIVLSGAGSAEVFVKKSMTVSIYGSGDVRYKGSPQIESNIYGSGNIEKASSL